MSKVDLFEKFRKAAGSDLDGVEKYLNGELQMALSEVRDFDVTHHLRELICGYVESTKKDFRDFVVDVRDLLFDSRKLRLTQAKREELFVLICKQTIKQHDAYHNKRGAE